MVAGAPPTATFPRPLLSSSPASVDRVWACWQLPCQVPDSVLFSAFSGARRVSPTHSKCSWKCWGTTATGGVVGGWTTFSLRGWESVDPCSRLPSDGGTALRHLLCDSSKGLQWIEPSSSPWHPLINTPFLHWLSPSPASGTTPKYSTFSQVLVFGGNPN